MLLLLLHTRREQGARTSSAVMSARLSVWAKITGHRTPASQLSAAASTGYTQHTIPCLRRNVYTGAHNCTGLRRKGCIASTVAPTIPGASLVENRQLYCLFSISDYALLALFGYYYGGGWRAFNHSNTFGRCVAV